METELTTDYLEDLRVAKNAALERYRLSRGMEDRHRELDDYVEKVAEYEHVRAIISDQWLAGHPEMETSYSGVKGGVKHPDQLREAVDMVNEPPHYTAGDIECIDAIREALGPDGFRAFCRGNALKYLWRCEHKGNAQQDIDKASWYLDAVLVSYQMN